jgi:hypothetical protein
MARWRAMKALKATAAYREAPAEVRVALEERENMNLMAKRVVTPYRLILVLFTDLFLLILDRHASGQSAESVAQRLGYAQNHATDENNSTFETLAEGAEDRQPEARVSSGGGEETQMNEAPGRVSQRYILPAGDNEMYI